MLVGRFPIFGLYVQMFTKGFPKNIIEKLLVKFLCFSCCQLSEVSYGLLLSIDGLCIKFLHFILKLSALLECSTVSDFSRFFFDLTH